MINLMAPINPLGYGVVGLNIAKAISSIHKTSLFPIGEVEVTSQEDADVVKLCLQNREEFDAKAPCLRIWHQFSMAEQIGNGLRCGFPIFELDAFNDTELHHLNSLDKVFVCSQWAKDVVCDNLYNSYKRLDLKDNVHVVPLGVDLSIFKHSQNSNNDNTRFINIGKWEYRKGHDVLVEAFNKAFEPEDNVELYMMNHNPFLNKEQEREWVDLYKTSKLGDKINILPRVATHSQVAEIMSQMDCGVFPSRAEGWNLEAIEMLAMGKELIITDYSAHTEFCNEKNSKLIPVDKKESAYDGIWFHGQGEWAEVGEEQIDSMVEHMRAVHASNKDANTHGIETAKSLSWDNSAKILSQHIFSKV